MVTYNELKEYYNNILKLEVSNSNCESEEKLDEHIQRMKDAWLIFRVKLDDYLLTDPNFGNNVLSKDVLERIHDFIISLFRSHYRFIEGFDKSLNLYKCIIKFALNS